MGKTRCAFENSRFEQHHFVEVSGLVIHMKEDRKTPVDPPHEAIEGRRVEPGGDGFALKKIEAFPPLHWR